MADRRPRGEESEGSYHQVRLRAEGRWPQILANLGVDVTDNPRRHSPCPGCGGKDRFRFDDLDGRGTFICGGGGDRQAGDGFALVQHVLGYTPKEALEAVNRSLGGVKLMPMPANASPKRGSGQRKRALELWMAADRSDAAVALHPYAKRKRIGHAFGAGVNGGLLLVPIRVNGTGKVISVQAIDADADKRTYGSMEDAFLMLGNTIAPDGDIYCVEGWADAYGVITTFSNVACAISFGMGRLDRIGNLVAEQFDQPVTIIEDGQK
jgi:putative DNA primase/helicase